MKKISPSKGFSPIIAVIAVIAIIAVAGIGIGIYLMQSKKSAPAPAGSAESAAPKTVEDITVTSPDLEFSFSALPTLEVSSVNLQAPTFPGQGMFKSFSVDSDFMPTVDTSLDTPTVEFNPPPLPERPSAPTTPTAPTTPPGGGTPTTDCTQFSSVPSCSYVGAPGSPGYEACKTCYPNK